MIPALNLDSLLQLIVANEGLCFNLARNKVASELLKIIHAGFNLLKIGLELLDSLPMVRSLGKLSFSALQNDLSLKHERLLLSTELTDLSVLRVDLMQLEQTLVGASFHLNGLNLFKCLFIDLQALQLGADLCQGRPECLLLLAGLGQGLLHLCHLLLELHRAADFLQNGKEAVLALGNNVLHLALLNNLKLRVAL